jgi:hypothetical protein
MISRKLFGQLNKLQVNDFAPVIMRDETWVCFENPRSVMLVGADVRSPIRHSQLIGAKKIMFSVCFTRIGIVDIVMLSLGETFDWFFFVDIVLDSLKKKLTQIPDPNRDKGHCLRLEHARPHLADHEIQANKLTGAFDPAHSPDLARPTSGFLGI